jgi:hypothetical protein
VEGRADHHAIEISAELLAPAPKVWVKSKNPASAAVRREREEQWR